MILSILLMSTFPWQTHNSLSISTYTHTHTHKHTHTHTQTHTHTLSLSLYLTWQTHTLSTQKHTHTNSFSLSNSCSLYLCLKHTLSLFFSLSPFPSLSQRHTTSGHYFSRQATKSRAIFWSLSVVWKWRDNGGIRTCVRKSNKWRSKCWNNESNGLLNYSRLITYSCVIKYLFV